MSNSFNSMENNNLAINILKSGDQSTFENVYRCYYKGLCSFGSQYVPLEEAEEIVQDTMMWLWENREDLNSELSLKSLLFTIVKNKALNNIKHEDIRRKVHSTIAEKYREEFESPDFYLNNELFHLYKKALAKLPTDFQMVFEMNRMQHLTHKEIAELLNISPQTVNYRISQVLKLLRTELKDYLPILLFFLSRQ